MLEWGFLFFWIFLLFFFFGIFIPGSIVNGTLDYNFFSSFLAYLIPFWLRLMLEWDFLIFFNFFCYFCRNFLARVEYERNSGIKLFSPFLGLPHPVLAKNNAGMRIFNFLNFFAIFSVFSCTGMDGIRD